jgi:hypothetical protein
MVWNGVWVHRRVEDGETLASDNDDGQLAGIAQALGELADGRLDRAAVTAAM